MVLQARTAPAAVAAAAAGSRAARGRWGRGATRCVQWRCRSTKRSGSRAQTATMQRRGPPQSRALPHA
eukprot:63423-Chlamydomonas_euryale.AAC.1